MKKALAIISVTFAAILFSGSAPSSSYNSILEREIQQLTERGLRVQLFGDVVEATDPVSGQTWQFSTEMLMPRQPTYTGLPTLTVDLTTIDTNLYNWKFHYENNVQLTGGWGFPLPVLDFDGNGRAEAYGIRQTQSDVTTRSYERGDNDVWMFRYAYPGQIGIFDKSGDVDNNGLQELYARYGDSLFVFEQPATNSIPTISKFRHRQWYLNATGIPNEVDQMTSNGLQETVYRGSEPATSDDRTYIVRYDTLLNNFRRIWSTQVPHGCQANGCTGAIATGDFDGDGEREFVTSNFGGSIYVFEHAMQDSFVVTWTTNVSTAGRVASGDVDGNGINEFFVGGTQAEPDGYVHLRANAFERTVDNTYQPIFSFDIFPAGIFFVDLYQTTDIDGDGIPELLLSFAGGIVVIRGFGEHNYQLFYYRSVSSLDGISAWRIDSSGAAHLFVSRAIGSQQIISQTDVYSIDSLLITSVYPDREIPSRAWLFQNYPNPFNNQTTISYELPHRGRVKLQIFDILGKEVIRLVDELQPAGRYATEWKSAENSSGVYLLRLTFDQHIQTRNMLYLK